MVDNERGIEAGGSGGSAADDGAVDLLADAEEEDTAAVIERLRESGPRQHVSAESVDDVLSELDGDVSETGDGRVSESDVGSEQDAEDGGADSEASGGLVGGGPTTTVSQEGIDEVFEKLEAETPDHDERKVTFEDEMDDGTSRNDEAAPDDQTDAPSGSSSGDDGFGTLSGGGPTKTVSDEGVDEMLSQVSDDVDYATFHGDDAPDVAAETEVDPDAVFPDDWETADAGEDADAVPEPDEHTPGEDADDLRPDDDDAVLDLFADVADEVNEGSSTAEPPDERAATADEPDVDLTETASGLFEDESADDELFEDDSPDAGPDSITDDVETNDGFAATDDGFAATDDGFAATDDVEPAEDGLDPSLADEVDALLSAADEVDAGTESETTIDSLDDAEAQDGPDAAWASQTQQDAPSQTRQNEEAAADSPSRLALNASDDAGIEWSEDDADDEQSLHSPETAGTGSSDPLDGGTASFAAGTAETGEDDDPSEAEAVDATGDDDRSDTDRPDDDRRFASLRYARAAASWLRSLLARLA